MSNCVIFYVYMLFCQKEMNDGFFDKKYYNHNLIKKNIKNKAKKKNKGKI